MLKDYTLDPKLLHQAISAPLQLHFKALVDRNSVWLLTVELLLCSCT